MSNIGVKILSATDTHEVTKQKTGTLGGRAQTRDGRIYRYAQALATGSALAAGATVVANAVAAVTTTTTAAYKPGARTIAIAGTVSAANQPLFVDGVVTIAGANYLVEGVTADGKSIQLTEALDVAVASGAAVVLTGNQFNGIAAGSTSPIGTVEVAVPAGFFCWVAVPTV